MNDKKNKSRGLGRGLSALMAETSGDIRNERDGRASASEQRTPIERILPNPDQPRRQFDQEKLDDLTNSIREKGIIQPLIVRPDPNVAGSYQIVAGERRWRAAQKAQLHEIPVIVRDIDDTELLEIAIIENIQRDDLNPVEEAVGFKQLIDKFGHTQEKLAKALGKSRSHIANQMRLLSLPKDVLGFLSDGKLSAGHARALITSSNPSALARDVVKRGLSVRQTERLAKEDPSAPKRPQSTKPQKVKDADTVALENDLSANLRMKVEISHLSGSEAGKMVISYSSLDDLDDLCQRLT
ncbi:ParB/RepB/Spo0J family partition protein [Lentibacter algarum]|uniref:ParB/RepB/Spo0J family partition protein n=1 Tax=Lentibacter algarum TaxID=576131 RepID=UPI001C069D9B|nr:ParB/RepB/Spo0J family partition protein [Lentibacter algarum]MBU2980325.1 ParB/RepB/Spo0J family partition protein [Lentibacter algarum]